MLEGMSVLSLTHFVQGPSAAQYLADMGADVVKVEPPAGAWERRVGSGGIKVNSVSATFLSVNRNQRSLVADLKHPDALRALQPLLAQTDVVIENYRRGALDRLGLGYDAVKKLNPGVIYASATGWGGSGPLADEPGVDILVQARTGLISVTGDRRAGPVATGTPVIDHHGGALLAMGVLGAYAQKLRTGRGTRVESSLLGAGLDLQAESLALYYSGQRSQSDIERPAELAAWSIDPPYGVYRLADGHVVIAISGNMDGLATAVDCPALAEFDEEARRRRRDEYTALLSRHLADWTYDRLHAALAPRGFWIERVADYDDVRRDPQVAHEGFLDQIDVGGQSATVVRHPIRYDGALPAIRREPPGLGDHTREVLTGAGWSASDVETFIASGALGAGAQR